ncbi:hypothetical protein L596_020843 [Steinernema carpocapsae]|uniref:Uncharacterized protein n=1 Tax=Steinernema carpocapsae TaxID=34508 RepID=A0A4U5MUY3_STECR|nr:hypothetical protein L596_020843 [Steinernema carpocapsae]
MNTRRREIRWIQKRGPAAESAVGLGWGSAFVRPRFVARRCSPSNLAREPGSACSSSPPLSALLSPRTPESSQARDRKAKSNDLTDTTDNQGNNLLVATMVNISLQLTGEEAIEWHAILDECNATSHNASMTSDDIVVQCSSEIKLFFKKFPDCNEKFRYFMIGGWGDFSGLFQVSIWINADFAESVIIVENGKCKLEEAILEFEATISEQSEKDALEELRAEISFCVNDASLSYEEKMANISLTFINFFKLHAAWEADIRHSRIDIPGFGSIDAFLDVSMQFYRIANFDKLFIGSRFPPTSPPTTSPAPTTAPVQGDCSSAPSLLSIFNGNMTIFYQSSDTYLKNNPGTRTQPQLASLPQHVPEPGHHEQHLNRAAEDPEDLLYHQPLRRNQTARISFVYSIPLAPGVPTSSFCTCGGF